MKTTNAALAALLCLVLAPLPAPAEPPPHAKAHGWRKKNDPTYVGYTGKRWEKDYGIIEGRCNSAAIGAVLGGATGAMIGSRVADGDERPVAILLGATIGAVIGSKIGQSIDDGDRGCIGHALELAGERKTVVWTNARSGVTYRLTPTRNFKRGAQSCREFTTLVSAGKKKDSVKGVACRRGAGDWVLDS